MARVVKEVIERGLAAALVLALAPLLLVIAGLVRLTSRGPALHRRRVLGLHGQEFDAFKFRTMRASSGAGVAEGAPTYKLRRDPRVTTVGRLLRRTSLDELPQLLNVVRGEMSLVGPRMIAPDEALYFGAALAKRQTVKPGITGLWQVSGRDQDYARRLALDLEYIDGWSLWLDVKILVKTIPAVLSMRGAY